MAEAGGLAHKVLVLGCPACMFGETVTRVQPQNGELCHDQVEMGTISGSRPFDGLTDRDGDGVCE